MAETNERTKVMMETFIEHWKDGKTIDEIAKLYEVSKATVYKHLQEIANNNGITREELLKSPHKEHILVKSREYDYRKRVDAMNLKESFSKMITEADNIINTIDSFLTENEQEEK